MEHEPIGRVRFRAGPLTAEVEVPVVGARTRLEVQKGNEVAEYEDGSCAAVTNHVGEGRTLLMGVMPGHVYSYTTEWREETPHYREEVRRMIVRPALQSLDRSRVECSEPVVEVCLFEHEKGLAVTLNDFTYEPGRTMTLSVDPQRDVGKVTSTMRRELHWKKTPGGRIEIECTVPEPVDVILLQ